MSSKKMLLKFMSLILLLGFLSSCEISDPLAADAQISSNPEPKAIHLIPNEVLNISSDTFQNKANIIRNWSAVEAGESRFKQLGNQVQEISTRFETYGQVLFTFNTYHEGENYIYIVDRDRNVSIALPIWRIGINKPASAFISINDPTWTEWKKFDYLGSNDGGNNGGDTYGDTKQIPINESVPSGWIVTAYQFNSKTITYIEGANYRASLNISNPRFTPNNATIPTGWVLTQVFRYTGGDYITRTIRYAGGASYGNTLDIVPDTTQPENWVVVRVESGYWRIRYVGGASYGKIEEISPNVAQPKDWIVISVGDIWKMKYVGGARIGARETMVFNGGFPSGWVVISTDGQRYQTIEYRG